MNDPLFGPQKSSHSQIKKKRKIIVIGRVSTVHATDLKKLVDKEFSHLSRKLRHQVSQFRSQTITHPLRGTLEEKKLVDRLEN